MGQLTPGATYVYERVDGITYARKLGDDPNNRVEVGRNYEAVDRVFGIPVTEIAKIVDMIKAAEHNPALQDALERVKLIYELSKKEEPLQHHPV